MDMNPAALVLYPRSRAGPDDERGQRVPDASLSESRLYELMRGGRFILLDRNDDGRVARTVKEGWADRVDIVRSSIAATPD